MTDGANAAAFPVGEQREPIFASFVQELAAIVPLRRECSKNESLRVVDLWTRWCSRACPGSDLDAAVSSFRSDCWCWRMGEWQLADYACTLAEAHRLQGEERAFLAFLDAGLAASSVKPLTRLRLERMARMLNGVEDALKLTDAELDILQALPVGTLRQLAERSGHDLSTVKRASPKLQAREFMVRIGGRSFDRTEKGTDALTQRGRTLTAPPPRPTT